jgi:hypothetical protein
MVLLPMVVISTIQNKGIEIEFDATVSTSFKWNVFLKLNRVKLKELSLYF